MIVEGIELSSVQAAASRALPGRLDITPLPTARAALPADFAPCYLIFGDAEEEFDWSAPFHRDATSTRAMGSLPDANRRLMQWGCVPTYLADYPVVNDPTSAAILRQMVERGECDVGAQLHPWVTPPHEELLCPINSFAGNLPIGLEAAKLRALTRRIEEAVGVRPEVYRAGRYGVGPNSAMLLEAEGYRLDVSVRSLFEYRGEGGPDFSRCPVWPWWVTDRLLELPLTAAFTGRWSDRAALHRPRWSRSALARTGLLNRVSLTPEGMPAKEAVAAIERLLDAGTQIFSLSFHTPSVEIGHTPYVRNASDLRAFWGWWDAVLNFFAARDVRPARYRDILVAADTARGG
jgi:hypothetical protein